MLTFARRCRCPGQIFKLIAYGSSISNALNFEPFEIIVETKGQAGGHGGKKAPKEN
jgi:hypothetical protein